jgi:methionine-rich copper-binding protein CopC
MSRALRVAAVVALLFALFPGRAGAHAELQSADPEPRSVVDEVPETVTLRLTEPAAPQSRIVVDDGCERDVTGATSIDGRTVEITTADAQPGRWRVEYRLLSAVDGHVVQGEYRFRVEGEPDCPEESHDNGESEPEEAAPLLPDEGGGLPLVPIVIGTGVLAAIALAVRMLGSR